MKIISSSTYDEMMHNHLELTEDLYFEIPSGEKLRKFCKKIRYGLHPEIFNYYREHDLDLFTVYKDYLVIHNDSLWKELKKKDEDSKMIKTNYTLDELGSKFKYSILITAPINDSITYDLIDIVKSKFRIDKDFNIGIFKVINAIYSDDMEENLGYYLSDNNNMGFPLCNGGYEFILDNGKLTVESDQVSSNKPCIKKFTCSFELSEKKNQKKQATENVNSGSLESSGPWHEPEKVKAIRETIEAVMKNTGKTDLKDIDLDMLSSCINATFNREKMFYKWLNEFTNEEVDDKTIKFAFKFLDWVLLNKLDSEKTNGICFKE